MIEWYIDVPFVNETERRRVARVSLVNCQSTIAAAVEAKVVRKKSPSIDRASLCEAPTIFLCGTGTRDPSFRYHSGGVS